MTKRQVTPSTPRTNGGFGMNPGKQKIPLQQPDRKK